MLWTVVVAYLGLSERRGVLALPDELAEPTQHFVSFAVLASLLTVAFPGRHWWIGAGLSVIGAAGEFVQLTTADRQFDEADIVVNVVGVAVGIGVVVLWEARIAGAVVATTAVLLVTGPTLLLIDTQPTTSFPSECEAAPPSADGEPIILVEDLSDSDQTPNTDVSVAQITEAVSETSELAVEAWFQTSDLRQSGPVRIFTISEGVGRDQVNFHLGLDRDDLSIRLRTECELFNSVQVDDVIVAERLHHVVVTWSNGALETWVDGARADRTELPWGDFSAWDSNFDLVIGDELGGGRQFVGRIESVTMWDRALDDDVIAERGAVPPT